MNIESLSLSSTITMANSVSIIEPCLMLFTEVSNFMSELQGGMSNELYNSIARVTDGIYEGWTFCCTPFSPI